MTDDTYQEFDDNPARTEIINDTDKSAFVAAGAGAGKTTSMAKRIVATVCRNGSRVELSKIVAVTFTERAAAELRTKILELLNQAKKDEFPKRNKEGSYDPFDLPLVGNIDPNLAVKALSQLDSTSIGTIHSFALRILQEYPAQSRLPLKVTMMSNDEVTATQEGIAQKVVESAFDERVHPHIAAQMPALFALGATSAKIKSLLVDIQRDWLRIGVPAILRIPERVAESEHSLMKVTMAGWYEANQAVIAAQKTENGMKLADAVRALLDALNDPFDINRLREYQMLVKASWKIPKTSNLGKSLHAEVREPLHRQFGSPPLVNIDEANALVALLRLAAEVIAKEQISRRDRGDLSFDDLIDLFKNLLDKSDEVVAELHSRFKVYIVDEFQDTDPAQVAIFEKLTLDADRNSGDRVFVAVGDYMQSIYRFRGADVGTYLESKNTFPEKFGNVHKLTMNFRSNEHILGWVNKIYSHSKMQPEATNEKFQRLGVYRKNVVGGKMSEHVFQIPANVKARLEPKVVANAVLEMITQDTLIRDEGAIKGNQGARYWANYNDVAILIPTRSAQAEILEELFIRGIPVRTADSKIIFERPLVKGLVCAAKVVLGVGNDLDLWFTLQSPLFGHTSAELLDYRMCGGRWSTYQPDASEEVRDTPVYRSLTILSALSRDTKSQRPHEALSGILLATNSIEAHSQLDRGSFEVDCVSRVLDHAKTWQGTRSDGFPEYLTFLTSLVNSKGSERMPGPASLEPARVGADEPKPEVTPGAVEISTVHGVKGLEFPIVFVAGLGRGYKADSQSVIVYRDPDKEVSLEYRIGELESQNYTAASEDAKKQGRDEKLRLLYVAATRARDYLVFSNASPDKEATTSWSKLSTEAVKSMVSQMGSFDKIGEVPEFLEPVNPDYGLSDLNATPTFDRDAVIARIADYKISNPSRAKSDPSEATPDDTDPVYLIDEDDSAEGDTGIDEDIDEPRDYSENSVIGTVFHRAMEHIILNRATFNPKNLDPHLNYAVEDARKDKRAGYRIAVEDLVKQAITSNLVKRALVAELVKTEMPVNYRDANQRPIQGTIDLLIREEGVFIIVDYKTGLMSDGQKKHYEAQMNAYRTPLTTLFPDAEIVTMLLHVTDKSATEYVFAKRT